MSRFSAINTEFSVAPQLTHSDFEQASAAGFKAIINFRPDGETPGYMSAEEGAAVAASHGLEYRHIPVPVNGLNESHIESLGAALRELPGPVLGHCGTGKRAAVVWALASAGVHAIEEILHCCAGAGHDLSPMRPHLEARAATA